ncbi:MAG: hypothetical protein WDZ72_12850, partial [Cyclobacteriaceae bacterium]
MFENLLKPIVLSNHINGKRFLFGMLLAISLSFGKNAAAQGVADVPDHVLLELYQGARVTDVVDGLVTVGYMDVGVMDPTIAPLWRDVETMEHRFSGIAVTVR